MSPTQIPGPFLNQIRELIGRGEAAQVVSLLQPICDSSNTNVEYWFFYGVANAETGNMLAAANAFEHTIKIAPSHLAALTNLGRVYNALNKNQQAITPLKQALTLNPSHKPAALQLITSYITLQQLDEAEAICDGLNRGAPYDAEILLQFGIIRKIQNKFDNAIAFYDQALTLKPGAIPVLMNKGLALQSAGRIDEAISLFHQVTQQAPTMAQAWHILAMAWLVKSDLTLTIQCFEKAFELNPLNIEAGIQLAKSYRHTGKTSDCEAVCKKILEIEPDNAEALFFQSAYSKQENEEILDRIPAEVSRQMYKGSGANTSLGKSFNDSLTASLEYKAPDVLNMAFRQSMNLSDDKIDILELGCGSGLCGSKFSDIANTLVGTDISPDMLEGAKEKNTYTELYEADLIDVLNNYESKFDLVIAMDVLCFFGDLTEIFKRTHKTLKQQGIFGFSVVKPKTNVILELQPYGHFVHSLKHLQEVAEKTGFKQIFAEKIALRRELNEDQLGYVCLYQRA